MRWYVYQTHLFGNLYVSPNKFEHEDLYCAQCGDTDILMDVFDTEEEAKRFIESHNIDGECNANK